MHSPTQQDPLEIVSTLATPLADRMLRERLTRGTLPLADADRLWTASLLLEAHRRPVPRIVAAVAARRVAPARRAGRLTRLLRPFQRPAEAGRAARPKDLAVSPATGPRGAGSGVSPARRGR